MSAVSLSFPKVCQPPRTRSVTVAKPHALDRRNDRVEPVGVVRVREREHDAVLPRRAVALVLVRAEPAAALLLVEVVERRVDLGAEPVGVVRLESEGELGELGRHVLDGRGLVGDRGRLELVEGEVGARVGDDSVLEATNWFGLG